MTKSYLDLKVRERGIDLAEAVYAITRGFPKEEIYGMASQMRRAAVSVSSNIAEGSARGSDKEFIKFLNIALGSLAELKTQFFIARRVKLILESDFPRLSKLLMK